MGSSWPHLAVHRNKGSCLHRRSKCNGTLLPAFKGAWKSLRHFNQRCISERWDPKTFKVLETAIDETLAAVFGHNSAQYRRYQKAAKLDHGQILMGRPAPLQQVQKWVCKDEGRQTAILLLGQAIRGLNEEIQERKSETAVTEPEGETQRDLSRVFIVHGHDGEVKEAIARFLSERLGLEPVILHERPNKGRTIITKFPRRSRRSRALLCGVDDCRRFGEGQRRGGTQSAGT